MFFSKEIDFYYLNFTWKLNKLNKIIHVYKKKINKYDMT